MYYQDLTFYSDIGDDGWANVYPQVLNIGWLDSQHDYVKGDVPESIISKLKEILFLDLKNEQDRKLGIFIKEKATIVHLMHMRGSPYLCSFCARNNRANYLEPNRLKLYSDEDNFILGMNEVCIPSLGNDFFYSFPTMLYHYIVDHGYKPPCEFLNALAAFDIDAPYDIDKAQNDLMCIEKFIDEVD